MAVDPVVQLAPDLGFQADPVITALAWRAEPDVPAIERGVEAIAQVGLALG